MRNLSSRFRSSAIFLGASAAAHAAVLGVLPGVVRDRAPPPVALEVTLVEPEPLPVALPQAPSRQPPRKEPVPRKPQPTPAPRERLVEQSPPVLAPPVTAPAERVFTAPAPKEAEAPPAAAPKTQVAIAAVTPAAVGAAYLRTPAPPYPMAARRSGIEGTVLLRVLVSREGLPARVDVDRSSGSVHLDNAALEAVKGWRFTPARRGAETVEGVVTFPIVFRLEGAS